MSKRTFTQSGSMVFRLRLSFLLIFIALVAYGLFSQARFGDISDRKGDLTQRAIPVLVRAQEMVTLLSIQSQQIAALRTIDTTADFDEIAQVAAVRHRKFDDSLAIYQSLSSDHGLEDAATSLFASTATLIDLQTNRQNFAVQRVDQVQQLREIIDLMDIEIEGLRLDSLTDLQGSIDRLASDPEQARRILPLSVQLNTLVSLGLLVEQMQDLAELAGAKQSQLGSVNVAEELGFNRRQILGLLNRIPASAARDALTLDLVRARAMISDAGGILDNADAQMDVEAEIAMVAVASIEQVQRIEAKISTTIADANTGAQETSQLLNQSIRTLTISNLVMIIGFFGGLVLVVILLVELQLNQRLQSLMASVRQLSVGNYDDHISVSGDDEIGTVANALRHSQDVARDLKRSNADLKSFAYAASHDLKTPLRAITDLAEWTLEDARDELSEDNLKNLELLSNRAERLSSLLDGLLLYAQIDGMAGENEVFELAAECAGIADLLDPDGKFSVTVDAPKRAFLTAATPLRQILNNLLSNAMKHHDKSSGHINVRATLNHGGVVIEVEDDGPGIAVEFHSQIFELFQKLESADVVEGAGIGLALVKKLAERHGGGVQIRRAENEGRGTVFTVLMSGGAAP